MMHQYILDLLEEYNLESYRDYENALKEIAQQVVLTGLWRTDFFNHCAFYGGTSLRIFYKLQRFSEDLDFTLYKNDSKFLLEKYFNPIRDELESMGFEAEITKKSKHVISNIESAFVKADTLTHVLKIGAPDDIVKHIHMDKRFKVKLEVDVKPPLPIETELKFLLQPVPCSIRIVRKDYLFAGKLHALLCRKWRQRVKGRDWYDFVWFVKTGSKLNLDHLMNRLIQTNDWQKDKKLTANELRSLLSAAIEALDLNKAKMDIIPFVKDSREIDVWSKTFFNHLVDEIEYEI